MPHESDIDPLLRRVAAAEPRALAELYDATARYVFGILRRMLSSPESAEEVAQEVYLQVWKRAYAFDSGRGSGWSWLALLTRSRALDRLRAEGSYREAVEGVGRDAPAGPVEIDGPHRETELANRAAIVRRAMADLPGDQRRAVELAFFGGLTHPEIAERTGIPLGTVKTRIRTAILKLRDRLGPEIDA